MFKRYLIESFISSGLMLSEVAMDALVKRSEDVCSLASGAVLPLSCSMSSEQENSVVAKSSANK